VDASADAAPAETDETDDADQPWPVLSALDLEVCLTGSEMPSAAHPGRVGQT